MKFKTDNKFWQLREQAAKMGFTLRFNGTNPKPLLLLSGDNSVICRKKTYSQMEHKINQLAKSSEQNLIAA